MMTDGETSGSGSYHIHVSSAESLWDCCSGWLEGGVVEVQGV